MPKVLIHSLVFSPDGVSTAYLYNDIALAFKSKGYDVVVLSTTPHFNKVEDALKRQPLSWKVPGIVKQSDFQGIRVYHIPQKKFKSTALRLVGFAYWHLVALIVALSIRKVDLIVSPSPPLTIGVLNAWIGWLKRCKVIYNVQEIYPDILNLKPGIVYNVLSRMERYVYRRSDAVTTIDQVFHDSIVDRMDRKEKLHIIPNFVDTDIYRPISRDEVDLPEDLFPRNDSLKLLYAGNIGFAQDWEPLIEIAKMTRDANIEYFVIGEGVMKDYLVKAKEDNGLGKLHILPYQPREKMPQIIAYSDLQFIFMHPKMDKQGFPSKVYTIMACGKPLLICSGADTSIVRFLEGSDCAKIITNRELKSKTAEMAEWLKNVTKDDLDVMGQRGLDIISKSYTKEIVTDKYVALSDQLLSRSSQQSFAEKQKKH